ncbi:MAG: putative toxin-antitoxin system toxin component, PIN family [Candidatus Deferrimicrobiaceae bacterium]
MRVVFDSNVLLAALMFPGGRADAAVARILEGRDALILSLPIIREILSVLASKFSRDKEELSRVAVVLGEIGTIVDPSRRLSVLRDEPDNRILECAVEGKAEVIVTGDKAMLALGEYEAIRLITLADYLDKPRPGGRRRA